jgi:phosphoribosylformimino-5-aminoimidazole carboxamide ribotide isomerase
VLKMKFQVIPAIDIQGGKAVRLRQGRAEDVTVFDDSPLSVARRFADAGASLIHVVDLDGAFSGKPENLDAILRIASSVGAAIEVGGGIRNYDTASRYLGGGVSRIVLGTSIIRDPGEVSRITKAYPGKVAAGIDAKDGAVAIRGWVEVTGVRAVDLALEMEKSGVSAFIYTDIARDGMMSGPNFESIRAFAKGLSTPVVASGGVTTLADVERLAGMSEEGVGAVIIGRAIYDGSVDLPEALKLERA